MSMSEQINAFKAAVLGKIITGKWKVTKTLDIEVNVQVCQNSEWCRELPVNWSVVRLKDVGTIVTGKTPSLNKKEGRPFYRPVHIQEEKYIKKTGEFELAKKNPFIKHGVVTCCIGAGIGRSCNITGEGTFNQQINGFTSENLLIEQWIGQVHKTEEFKDYLESCAVVTTLPQINAYRYKNLQIPLPPKEERERILDFIEKFDKSLPDPEPAVKALDEWYQSTLWHVMTGKMRVDGADSCEGVYEQYRIKDIAKIVTGTTPKSTEPRYYGDEYNWVQVCDLKGEFTSTKKRLTREGAEQIGLQFLCPKDTLIIALYASVGSLGRTMEPAIPNQAVGFLLTDKKADSKWLEYWLKVSKSSLIAKAKSSTQANLTRTILLNYEVPMPPQKERERILEFIEKLNKEYKTKRAQLIGEEE